MILSDLTKVIDCDIGFPSSDSVESGHLDAFLFLGSFPYQINLAFIMRDHTKVAKSWPSLILVSTLIRVQVHWLAFLCDCWLFSENPM